MLMLFFDAAIIGFIIAVMEQDEFPGWWPMIGSALFISLAGFAAESALPGIPGIIAGCVVAGLAGGVIISWACGMSFQRAAIAAGVFLTIKFLLGLVFYFMISRAQSSTKPSIGAVPVVQAHAGSPG